MKGFSKFALTMAALLIMLGGCTGLPAPTTSVPSQVVATAAPAATEAVGSTEAAPLPATAMGPTAVTPGESGPATAVASAEPPMTAEATAAPQPATTEAATDASIATTAPEPTAPPAPTAPATPEAAASVACTPGALTPEQTEGPYYKANPPESSDLLQAGMGGTKLKISGFVLDDQCKPVPGARVDFWQADSEGQYDNQGYTLRGYQVTDAEGRYTVETVVPGLYPGRTRHIHVKVSAPGGPTLTTQLYFPDEGANASDRIFSPELVLKLEKGADGETGTFNFVVKRQ